MNREEFIQYIFLKKKIDKDVVKTSKKIDDFPLAYAIINAISGQPDHLNSILEPKNYGEIDYAIGEIKRLCIIN